MPIVETRECHSGQAENWELETSGDLHTELEALSVQ